VPYAAGTSPAGIAVDPSGKFLFVANFASSNISVFTIDAATGIPTQVVKSPFTAGTDPLFVSVDPSGTLVFAGNQTSKNISSYTLNTTTGELTAVTGSPFATSGSVSSMSIQ
jgi:6-phosphogluconolactonase (cycloisomerase 2 family)